MSVRVMIAVVMMSILLISVVEVVVRGAI